MKTVLLIDKYNPNKAHHIKFKNGKVFYNQAIRQDNRDRKHKGATFTENGAIWYDFYKDQLVVDSEFHGYREYIEHAKTLLIEVNFSELKELIIVKRKEAEKEAKECLPVVRSRGVYLCAYDKNGEKINDGFDCQLFKLTKTELLDNIESLKKEGAISFFLDGGFDGAENLRDLNDFEYVPFISCWSLDFIPKENGNFLIKSIDF